MESILNHPLLSQDEFLYISPEGYAQLGTIYDPKAPSKNVLWTTDISVELPLKIKKYGPGSEQPKTLIEVFEDCVSKIPDYKALMVKRNGEWVGWTFAEFHRDVLKFAKSLLALKISCFQSVNIIGFNSPEWLISYYGALYANGIPVGIYTTNNPDACKYVADHSNAFAVVVENNDQLQKYLQVWDKLQNLKVLIVWDMTKPLMNIPENRKGQVISFKDFLTLGEKETITEKEYSLEYRMNKQKPGNCATLVYTSGTTGPPKGVMLSHDNLYWTCEVFIRGYREPPGSPPERVVSFLPLSHVAAQVQDVIGCLVGIATLYFADASALQGTLINYLREVRPTLFFSVPRVWEKIEQQLKLLGSQSGFIKKSIVDWAKSIGREGTLAEHAGQSTPIGWKIAKSLVFNKIKQALGLDQAKYLMFGAAPMKESTREYFLSLNLLLLNGYGMSECTGPQNLIILKDPAAYNVKSAGQKLPGTDIKIYSPDKSGDGEVCFKGRNGLMGYIKDEQSSKKILDEQGYIHSGDVGHIDKYGNLVITGRIKELLITAGGENIAPVLIENEIKAALPFISNVVVVGDQRKYLCALITLKNEAYQNGTPMEDLSKESIDSLKELGIDNVKTVKDLMKNKEFSKIIEEGINQANKLAISRAHHIRKWALLEKDLSIPGEELTPTLKIKRNVVHNKYIDIIEKMYLDPKL